MCAQAKRRAKQSNAPFDISYKNIDIPEICPILKIKIEVNDKKVGKNSPSLDRIIPEKGYVKDNIQVISHLANTMKSSATPEELLNFANWVIKIFKVDEPQNHHTSVNTH